MNQNDNSEYLHGQEKLRDTKAVIRNRKMKNDRQHNDQRRKDKQHNDQKRKDKHHNGQKRKDKQWSAKHYQEKIKIEQHEHH